MRFPKLFLLAAAVAAMSVPVDFSAQSYDGGGGGGFGGGGGGFGGGFGGRGGGGGRGQRGAGGGGFGAGRAGRFGGGAQGGFGARFGGGFGGFGNNAPERATSAPLELRGIVGRGENAMVSIINIETGESRWVRVRDANPRNKWFVESVNPKARNAVVRYEGMPMKLELITTTGEPMSIRPQPVPLAADSVVEGGANPRALASQMLSFGPFGAGGGSPEQMRAFGEQMQTLTPEQRTQVFDEFRRMRGETGGMAPGGAMSGVTVGGGGVDGPGAGSVRVFQRDGAAQNIAPAAAPAAAPQTTASPRESSSTGATTTTRRSQRSTTGTTGTSTSGTSRRSSR
jgi:hypothetical protein